MFIGGAAMVGAMVLVTVMPRLKPAARAATPAGLPDLRADRG